MIHFSQSMDPQVRHAVPTIFGIHGSGLMKNYLWSLPPIDAFPPKVQSNLVGRMRDHLQGWKSQTLTFAGILTLIKLVITYILIMFVTVLKSLNL